MGGHYKPKGAQWGRYSRSPTELDKCDINREMSVLPALIYIYNWIACGVCSIIVWFADNVPPSLCSTSACAVQFNCFLPIARACYVTFAQQCTETIYMRLCNGGTSMQCACGR